MGRERILTPEGNEVLLQYTSRNNYYVPLNLSLSRDESIEKHAEFIETLDSCIKWQTKKQGRTVYRLVMLSAMEVFMMAYRRRFYMPNFVSTTMKRIRSLSSYYTVRGWGNIVLQIDTSRFPNHSMIVKPNSTIFLEEGELLISCYSVFTFVGFTIEDGTLVIHLRVEDPTDIVVGPESTILGSSELLPEEWLKTRGSIFLERNLVRDELREAFLELCNSYTRFDRTRSFSPLQTKPNPIPIISYATVEDITSLETKQQGRREQTRRAATTFMFLNWGDIPGLIPDICQTIASLYLLLFAEEI